MDEDEVLLNFLRNINKKRLQQELQPFKGKTFFRVGLSQAALL